MLHVYFPAVLPQNVAFSWFARMSPQWTIGIVDCFQELGSGVLQERGRDVVVCVHFVHDERSNPGWHREKYFVVVLWACIHSSEARTYGSEQAFVRVCRA